MKTIRARCLRALLLAMLASPLAAASSKSTTVLPISNFVSAQNAGFCTGQGFILWEDVSRTRLMYVDYYGYQNSKLGLGLGTTTDGVVTEKIQKDGRALVHVVLHTDNALTWVDDDGFPPVATMLFGYTPAEVLSGATAALGDSTLISDFLMPQGPLPDFCQLLFAPTGGQQLLSLLFTADAKGALRAGSGLPEGTPGGVQTTQKALFSAPGFSGGGPNGDSFSAEHVNLFARVP